MAITTWIDQVAAVWGTIDNPKGGKVRSYAVYKKAEFPETISQYPSVISYVTRLAKMMYSAGGPNVAIYLGVSEFHLTPNVSKSNYPFMMQFYERIVVAAAANLQLGGSVEHFLLMPNDPIVPGALSYGGDDPHIGLVVNWTVKELLTLTVSVG